MLRRPGPSICLLSPSSASTSVQKAALFFSLPLQAQSKLWEECGTVMPGSVSQHVSVPSSGRGQGPGSHSNATWSGLDSPHLGCLPGFDSAHFWTLPALLAPSVHSKTGIFSLVLGKHHAGFIGKGREAQRGWELTRGTQLVSGRAQFKAGLLSPLAAFPILSQCPSPSLP